MARSRLRGIADRIERDADGRYVILDYKTGSVRSEKQVRTGLAPQLTLEAAILRRGGFARNSRRHICREIAYVKLKGGEPAGEYEADQVQGWHAGQPGRSRVGTADQNCPALRYRHTNPTARSCTRCGGRVTATTTISRA